MEKIIKKNNLKKKKIDDIIFSRIVSGVQLNPEN